MPNITFSTTGFSIRLSDFFEKRGKDTDKIKKNALFSWLFLQKAVPLHREKKNERVFLAKTGLGH